MIVLSLSFEKKASIKMSKKECETLFDICKIAMKEQTLTDGQYELLSDLAEKLGECNRIESSYASL